MIFPAQGSLQQTLSRCGTHRQRHDTPPISTPLVQNISQPPSATLLSFAINWAITAPVVAVRCGPILSPPCYLAPSPKSAYLYPPRPYTAQRHRNVKLYPSTLSRRAPSPTPLAYSPLLDAYIILQSIPALAIASPQVTCSTTVSTSGERFGGIFSIESAIGQRPTSWRLYSPMQACSSKVAMRIWRQDNRRHRSRATFFRLA